MLPEHALHLGGIDVLAAGDDQVLLAVVDEEVPVRIAHADVAAVIPALAQRLGRGLRVVPVFDQHVRPAHNHLAGRAVRHLVVVVIDDPAPRTRDPADQSTPAAASRPTAACRLPPEKFRSSRTPAAPARLCPTKASTSFCGTCVEPVASARRLSSGVSLQRGCSITACMVAGTSTLSVGLSLRDRRPASRPARSARAASPWRRGAAPAWSGC